MKNSADLGGCYPPWPSASVDNTLLDLQNSSYPTQPHSIVAKYFSLAVLGKTQREMTEFWVYYVLVPKAYDPSGLRHESRALGATILKQQRK